MLLSAGNKLGPHEILALIGKHGIRPARFLVIAVFATVACPFGLAPARLAATLGSQSAQYFLGDHYQRGEVVEQNAERAKNYFRLCAAFGRYGLSTQFGPADV